MISPFTVSGNPYSFLNARDHSLSCGDDFVYKKNTGAGPGYQSMDPRTFDSPRAIRLVLDRPPLQSRNTQPQERMYTDPGNQTGFYRDYRDIRGGNIFYYTDLDQADPYGIDPYTITSYNIPEVQVDPMGGLTPVYQKVPVFKNNRNLSAYTSDQDQMQFREDLMALQSRKINQSDYLFYNLYRNPDQFADAFDKDYLQARFPYSA